MNIGQGKGTFPSRILPSVNFKALGLNNDHNEVKFDFQQYYNKDFTDSFFNALACIAT